MAYMRHQRGRMKLFGGVAILMYARLLQPTFCALKFKKKIQCPQCSEELFISLQPQQDILHRSLEPARAAGRSIPLH